MLPLLLFFFLLSPSHTLEFSPFPCLLVFPVHKPTTSLEPRSLWALQPLRKHKMLLIMGCWTMKDGGNHHLQPQLPLTTHLLSLSLWLCRRWRPWPRDDSRLPRWSSAKHLPDREAHPGRSKHTHAWMVLLFYRLSLWWSKPFLEALILNIPFYGCLMHAALCFVTKDTKKKEDKGGGLC